MRILPWNHLPGKAPASNCEYYDISFNGKDVSNWKANHSGGLLFFEFLAPVEEVLEAGLMNVVGEAGIRVTDADEGTRTFIVETSSFTKYREIIADDPFVSKLVVNVYGRSAVMLRHWEGAK